MVVSHIHYLWDTAEVNDSLLLELLSADNFGFKFSTTLLLNVSPMLLFSRHFGT